MREVDDAHGAAAELPPQLELIEPVGRTPVLEGEDVAARLGGTSTGDVDEAGVAGRALVGVLMHTRQLVRRQLTAEQHGESFICQTLGHGVKTLSHLSQRRELG
jgi:hypothetical protein